MIYFLLGIVTGLIIGCVIVGASEPSPSVPRPPIPRGNPPVSGDEWRTFLKPKKHGIR